MSNGCKRLGTMKNVRCDKNVTARFERGALSTENGARTPSPPSQSPPVRNDRQVGDKTNYGDGDVRTQRT